MYTKWGTLMLKTEYNQKRSYYLGIPDYEVDKLSMADYALWVLYQSEKEGIKGVVEARNRINPSSPKGYPEKPVKTQYKSFNTGSKPRVYNSWLD